MNPWIIVVSTFTFYGHCIYSPNKSIGSFSKCQDKTVLEYTVQREGWVDLDGKPLTFTFENKDVAEDIAEALNEAYFNRTDQGICIGMGSDRKGGRQ